MAIVKTLSKGQIVIPADIRKRYHIEPGTEMQVMEYLARHLAGELIRRFRAQGLTLDRPDAIIGATAIAHGLVLVTYNARHFPMPELRLYEEMPATA